MRLFFIAAILGVIVLLFFLYGNDISTYARLRIDFSSFITPHVTYNGAVFSVDNGGKVYGSNGSRVSLATERAVLGIAHYAAMHRLDPLFALGGSNLALLTESIEVLKRVTSEVATYYENNELVEKTLYPSFLGELPELENLRRSLVAKPSLENAALYHEKLLSTITTYQKEASSTVDALIQIQNSIATNKEYRFPVGSLTLEHVVNTLRKLAAEATIKQQEEKRRYQCVRGGSCRPLSVNTVRKNKEGHARPSTRTSLPQPVAAIRALTDNYPLLLPPSREEPKNLTAVVLTDSECIPVKGPVYYRPWTRYILDMPTLGALELNDLYFYDTEKAAADEPFFKRVHDEVGAKYVMRGLLQLYMCPDGGRELARISTALSVRADLAAEPLAYDNVRIKRWDELRRIENDIVHKPTLYESDVSTYMKLWGRTIKTYGERELAGIIGIPRVFRIEALLSLYQSRAPQFSHLLGSVMRERKLLTDAWGNGLYNIFPEELLAATKGAYSITFLSFSGSITEQPVHFLEKRELIPLDSFYLLSYNEVFAGKLSETELEQLIADSVAAHVFAHHRQQYIDVPNSVLK